MRTIMRRRTQPTLLSVSTASAKVTRCKFAVVGFNPVPFATEIVLAYSSDLVYTLLTNNHGDSNARAIPRYDRREAKKFRSIMKRRFHARDDRCWAGGNIPLNTALIDANVATLMSQTKLVDRTSADLLAPDGKCSIDSSSEN